MKSKNYVTVLGWMFNELKLNPTEVLVYALIYGFSQDNESEFKGSTKYIANTLNISKSSAIRTLDVLCRSNFIIKIVDNINGVTFNKYKVNNDVFQNDMGGIVKLKQGIVKLNRGGIVKLTPNINSIKKTIYIPINNTSKEEEKIISSQPMLTSLIHQ